MNTNKLRILHVIPSYLPAVRYGGPIYAVHGLCKQLATLGHQVDVYTTNVDGNSVHGDGSQFTVSMDGVGVHYFPVQTPKRLYYSPQLANALELNVSNYDLLHLHSLFLHPTLAAARCATKMGVPYLIAPRGMLVKDLIRRKNQFLKQAWIKLFERRTLEQARAIHVTSQLEADEIAQFGFKWPEILELANGVEPPEQSPVVLRDQNLILFLGRIHWKKGLDRLIPALSELPAAKLIIAGNDESDGYIGKLLELAKTHGVSEQVSFIGPVPGDDKWQLYQQASVFVLPSYSENFANTVLEAMAMACPVIVTPQVGLAHTVLEHGAGIVSPGDSHNLCVAIREILSDQARAEAMGKAGQRAVAEQYTWPEIASNLEKSYYRMLDNPPVQALA